MKWFLGFLLVVALVVGALYGVGRFLLPNRLDVTQTAQIDRPRAAVYAMMNDLKIVREWSPFYATDPSAEFSYSGEENGPGQTMRWTSNVREVGNGTMTILRSTENEEVEALLDLRDRATLNSVWRLTRHGAGSSVAWTVSAECAQGAINVPCRYVNLIFRRMIEGELNSGLARLKTMAEQLPNVDFEGLNPEFVQVEPQTFVFSVANTSSANQAEVDRAESLGLSQVRTFMSEYQLVASGPLMRVTTDWDATAQRMSFRVGYPFSGPTPLTVVGVQIGETPSGRALRVLHRGARSGMPETYAKIYAYLQAHRIATREDGLPWEVVLNEGAPAAEGVAAVPTQIEIYVPLQ